MHTRTHPHAACITNQLARINSLLFYRFNATEPQVANPAGAYFNLLHGTAARHVAQVASPEAFTYKHLRHVCEYACQAKKTPGEECDTKSAYLLVEDADRKKSVLDIYISISFMFLASPF